MKKKLNDCNHEKERAQQLLKIYERGEIPCRSCENLKAQNSKTKHALEQAVQLSNLLLQEVKRMEQVNYSL